MDARRSSFEYEDLLACGRGELFHEGPQLPLPPMLMFDRISEIAEAGGEYGKGLMRAALKVRPDLWFFPSGSTLCGRWWVSSSAGSGRMAADARWEWAK